MHPFVLSETLVVSLLLQGELSIFPVGIHLSVFSCSWPLNFSFSVWIFRVGMLLSGSFRTLKEKMYLSVTFTNSGNSSLCFPLQLCHAVLTLRMPLFFPFKTTNSCKMLCACMRHILLSAHLSAHAGLQFHSDDYFSRLRLINHWGLSAYLDPRQSVLISSGRFCWVFTPHRLSHLWSACCGSSGRQWTDAKADVGPHLPDVVHSQVSQKLSINNKSSQSKCGEHWKGAAVKGLRRYHEANIFHLFGYNITTPHVLLLFMSCLYRRGRQGMQVVVLENSIRYNDNMQQTL